MTVHDLKNALNDLSGALVNIQYPHTVDWNLIAQGRPSSLLPLLHYAFVDYSPAYYASLTAKSYILSTKNDLNFMKTVFKWMVEENYRPVLKIEQFFKETGFVARKLELVVKVLEMVQERANCAAPCTKHKGILVKKSPAAKRKVTEKVESIMATENPVENGEEYPQELLADRRRQLAVFTRSITKPFHPFDIHNCEGGKSLAQDDKNIDEQVNLNDNEMENSKTHCFAKNLREIQNENDLFYLFPNCLQERDDFDFWGQDITISPTLNISDDCKIRVQQNNEFLINQINELKQYTNELATHITNLAHRLDKYEEDIFMK